MNKKALICGISGQDGAYLSKFLVSKGYIVVGTSRDIISTSFYRLKKTGIINKVTLRSMAVHDLANVISVISDVEPDEIYYLSGQSSVSLSFKYPFDTYESVVVGTLNILEAVNVLGINTRFYHAASSECFGNIDQRRADENTPFSPRSPYAVAKSAAFWQVKNYREAYGLHASNGILFNHESPLRSDKFVTKKIVSTACRIANGSHEMLYLGNIEVFRDWGWAPEYVEAMWLINNHGTPDDYVVATGESYSLKDFISCVFESLGLDWKRHTVSGVFDVRPDDIAVSRANPHKVNHVLGWSAKSNMMSVAKKMVKAELKML